MGVTRSQDIHHRILVAIIRHFQCENDGFCKKNDNFKNDQQYFLITLHQLKYFQGLWKEGKKHGVTMIMYHFRHYASVRVAGSGGEWNHVFCKKGCQKAF